MYICLFYFNAHLMQIKAQNPFLSFSFEVRIVRMETDFEYVSEIQSMLYFYNTNKVLKILLHFNCVPSCNSSQLVI